MYTSPSMFGNTPLTHGHSAIHKVLTCCSFSYHFQSMYAYFYLQVALPLLVEGVTAPAISQAAMPLCVNFPPMKTP